jgi:hypothetical protein
LPHLSRPGPARRGVRSSRPIASPFAMLCTARAACLAGMLGAESGDCRPCFMRRSSSSSTIASRIWRAASAVSIPEIAPLRSWRCWRVADLAQVYKDVAAFDHATADLASQ